jgi:hypothetical protein
MNFLHFFFLSILFTLFIHSNYAMEMERRGFGHEHLHEHKSNSTKSSSNNSTASTNGANNKQNTTAPALKSMNHTQFSYNATNAESNPVLNPTASESINYDAIATIAANGSILRTSSSISTKSGLTFLSAFIIVSFSV